MSTTNNSERVIIVNEYLNAWNEYSLVVKSDTRAYVSIRQLRQHTSAYVSIRQTYRARIPVSNTVFAKILIHCRLLGY